MKNIPCIILLYLVFLTTLSGMPEKGIKKNPENKPAHIVFLISEDPLNYEAHLTIPPFAEMLQNKMGYKVTVLMGEGKHGAYKYPSLDVLEDADLLVVFCRRLALPFNQMDEIKNYLKSGRPLVGMRTANHAFSVREEVKEGHEGWWGFVPDILGCENQGYEPEKLGTEIISVPEILDHPILKNVTFNSWRSQGQVYKVKPILDPNAVILLNGKPKRKSSIEPIAWTRNTAYGGRVFYTSLGYPTDFDQEAFVQFIINGINWALGHEL